MNTSEHLKKAIQKYLEERAAADNLFAAVFQKANKNLNDCITYILNTVQQSGCNGFTDEEIYSMAVHYYDEDNIEIGKAIDCRVVVNHTVELTEEEKAQARKDAIQRVHNEAYARLTKSQKKPVKPATNPDSIPNLFGL